MHRLNFKRHFSAALFIFIVALVIASPIGLWWANQTGLPDSWRFAIEQELSKDGTHLKIARLSYIPFRGVVASGVQTFSDAQHTRETSRLGQIIIDIDKTKLARGRLRLNRVQLRNASLDLPLDPDNPRSGSIQINRLNGEVRMPGSRLYDIRNVQGEVAGVQIHFSANFLGKTQGSGHSNEDQRKENKRLKLFAEIIQHLDAWEIPTDQPPVLHCFMEGDTTHPATLIARFELQADGIGRNGHQLTELRAQGNLQGDLLTITELHARDRRGTLDGHVDYRLSTRDGRFDFNSTLNALQLLSAWAGVAEPRDLLIAGTQTLQAEGDFQWLADAPPIIRATGYARGEAILAHGIRFELAQGAFSWRDHSLLVRDAELRHSEGLATGKLFYQWPHVRLAVQTDLPPRVYKPLVKDSVLETVIERFRDGKDPAIAIAAEASFDLDDHRSWVVNGRGQLRNMSFHGVPIARAETGFSLSSYELDFYQGSISFDYQDYPLRKQFGGPPSGDATVGRIRYNAATHLVDVEKVRGVIWPAPLVRTFATEIADDLEAYRFHQPFKLAGDGVVDVNAENRTDLKVSFSTTGDADYTFFGENLTLHQAQGQVRVQGSNVEVAPLSFSTFEGPVAASIARHGDLLSGEIMWTKLNLPALSEAYDLTMQAGGTITGRLEFEMVPQQIETLSGRGLMSIGRTELFSVPMFGPLSPVVSKVLGDRQAGFQRAKDAFFSFEIAEGILRSDDFHTDTTSLTFTGNGVVNLSELTIDMTLRLNARGLLGLITLPLRPFYGLFQFRGTGPIKSPRWENVRFTNPPKNQQKILLEPPRAEAVYPD